MTNPLAETMQRWWLEDATRTAKRLHEDMRPMYAELGYETEDALMLDSAAGLTRSLRRANVRVLVLDEGLTQREAARRLGVAHTTVADDLCGVNAPPSELDSGVNTPPTPEVPAEREVTLTVTQVRERTRGVLQTIRTLRPGETPATARPTMVNFAIALREWANLWLAESESDNA